MRFWCFLENGNKFKMLGSSSVLVSLKSQKCLDFTAFLKMLVMLKCEACYWIFKFLARFW